jgi:hypothetical protein
MVVHAYNLSTWEAEAGGLQGIGQLELYSKSVSWKTREGQGTVTHAYNPSYLRGRGGRIVV